MLLPPPPHTSRAVAVVAPGDRVAVVAVAVAVTAETASTPLAAS